MLQKKKGISKCFIEEVYPGLGEEGIIIIQMQQVLVNVVLEGRRTYSLKTHRM